MSYIVKQQSSYPQNYISTNQELFDYPGTLVPKNKMIPQYTLDYLTTNISIKNRGVSFVHVFDFI